MRFHGGRSPSGKAPDFGFGIRRFESSPPSSRYAHRDARRHSAARETMKGPFAVIAGRSNLPLATRVASAAGVALTACDVTRHSDGEIGIEIKENVRGLDVFVVQSTSTPGNDHLMELLIMLDALKRASARRVTAVLPYFGYARQDRKSRPRQPITAKLIADLITVAGAHRVLTMDLHSGQIMGFFDLPVDNLYARPVFLKCLRDLFGGPDVCMVSPDAGGVGRARAYAARLEASLAIIDKRRVVANQVAEMNVVGDVRGKTAIIIDDMVDTGGTLAKAVEALTQAGAVRVAACCTHGVLSGSALVTLQKSGLEKLIVSDTVYHPEWESNRSAEQAAVLESGMLVKISVASILGEAIRRIHEESSVSSLFELE